MHVVILGAGGLGMVIGARLAVTGVEVTLVCRPPHAAAITERGLEVSGIHGNYTVRAPLCAVVDPAEARGPIDYLVLLTKTRGTDDALAGAAALRPRVATALSLQNSVTKNATLSAWIGAERVIGAITIEAGTLAGPGAVRHVATIPNSFYFGELDGHPSQRVTALVDAFRDAGMGANQSSVIAQVEWEKLLQIAVVAGFSASTVGFHPDAYFAHGIAVREGAEHYVTIARELLAVYRAIGYEPQDFFAPFSQFRSLVTASFDEAVASALQLGRTMVESRILGRPSLHEDIVRGRPTEVDDALGTFVRAARERDIAIPTALGAYRVIKTLESLPGVI